VTHYAPINQSPIDYLPFCAPSGWKIFRKQPESLKFQDKLDTLSKMRLGRARLGEALRRSPAVG